ncbi:MAG: hypothetical protein JNL32_01400 [Candidatus Kapabacteria bacterium]|nr:hypothetical protein [Candidatus Kapabacteria bacterium]
MSIYRRILIALLALYSSIQCLSQESNATDSTDSTNEELILPMQSMSYQALPQFNFLAPNPDSADTSRILQYGYLIKRRPDTYNYKQYYDLASSLWECSRIEQAKRMFMQIISSNLPQYVQPEHRSSDIPGDTVTTTYGYGSYTWNYKNSAAIYLTKIYILQRQFAKAQQFLDVAENTYIASYSCGTAYHMQRNEYDFLHCCIYEGLGKYDKVLDLLIPECLVRTDSITLRVLRKMYSRRQIQRMLQYAVESVVYSPDTMPSYIYHERENSAGERSYDTSQYYSATATTRLFGRDISLRKPWIDGMTRVTREMFIADFKATYLYQGLSEPYSYSRGISRRRKTRR